ATATPECQPTSTPAVTARPIGTEIRGNKSAQWIAVAIPVTRYQPEYRTARPSQSNGSRRVPVVETVAVEEPPWLVVDSVKLMTGSPGRTGRVDRCRVRAGSCEYAGPACVPGGR